MNISNIKIIKIDIYTVNIIWPFIYIWFNIDLFGIIHHYLNHRWSGLEQPMHALIILIMMNFPGMYIIYGLWSGKYLCFG